MWRVNLTGKRCSGGPKRLVMDAHLLTFIPIRNHLRKDLPAPELASVRAHVKEFSPRQGTILQEVGQAIEVVFFPETALVLLWSVLANGNAVGCAMVGCDGAIGIQAD